MTIRVSQAPLSKKTRLKEIDEQNYIKFSLDRMWKGKGESQLTFATKECPVTFFKMGRQYLVYGNYIEESKHIDISYGRTNCTRTIEIIPWWKVLWRNIGTRFDRIPGVYDNKIHDFEKLGAPKYNF